MSKRESSDIRVKTGTFLSVYLSSNFAWSTAIKHEFSKIDTLKHISKYAFSSLVLSFPYFILNEEINYQLAQKSIKNYFLSYSLTSSLIIPPFAVLQRFRGFSWTESRLLSYRYVGTLCCLSLVFELVISTYRNLELDNINPRSLNFFQSSEKTEELIQKVEKSQLNNR